MSGEYVLSENLTPGMVIIDHSRPDVEVLRDMETWEDRFGIERIKYWAKRLDTGQEGYMTYGYGARVPVKEGSGSE